ncbi:SRPBCC domain-containing protein [Glycocaulis sp.]|uniref:SRPBCC domain-containing protein n=1 Tax=Glycocaulis sp. TaxID=1969725 RepID=UPI0025B8B203|nr:SRPBCC domain-containing protein [Glycocaulis sp.]MCH8521681.1 SRPBCC domain-containing protein [Glycocaulis sp.]
MTLSHDTVRFERSYDAMPEQVFAAGADSEAMSRWAVPGPDHELRYEASDFRVGGRDLARCGAKGDLRFRAEVLYLDIVQNERIVFAETISEAGKPLCAALVSIEIAAAGAGTRQIVTCQVTEFVDGMADGYRHGYGASLDNLAGELARAA